MARWYRLVKRAARLARLGGLGRGRWPVASGTTETTRRRQAAQPVRVSAAPGRQQQVMWAGAHRTL